MRIAITSRHLELNDQLKEYIHNKVAKLKRYFPNLMDANIILEQNRYQYITEISIHSKPFDLFAKSESPDIKKSVISAVNKIERQVKKHKERLQERKQSAPEATTAAEAGEEEE